MIKKIKEKGDVLFKVEVICGSEVTNMGLAVVNKKGIAESTYLQSPASL